MHLYPEVASSISESWQAGKWRDEVPLDELSPMWADWETSPDRHFYVDEVACTKEGKYILPKRWIVIDGKDCAEGHPVYFTERVSPTEFSLIYILNLCLAREVSRQNNRDYTCSSKRLTVNLPRD